MRYIPVGYLNSSGGSRSVLCVHAQLKDSLHPFGFDESFVIPCKYLQFINIGILASDWNYNFEFFFLNIYKLLVGRIVSSVRVYLYLDNYLIDDSILNRSIELFAWCNHYKSTVSKERKNVWNADNHIDVKTFYRFPWAGLPFALGTGFTVTSCHWFWHIFAHQFIYFSSSYHTPYFSCRVPFATTNRTLYMERKKIIIEQYSRCIVSFKVKFTLVHGVGSHFGAAHICFRHGRVFGMNGGCFMCWQ